MNVFLFRLVYSPLEPHCKKECFGVSPFHSLYGTLQHEMTILLAENHQRQGGNEIVLLEISLQSITLLQVAVHLQTREAVCQKKKRGTTKTIGVALNEVSLSHCRQALSSHRMISHPKRFRSCFVHTSQTRERGGGEGFCSEGVVLGASAES